jgi:hypothetical protein
MSTLVLRQFIKDARRMLWQHMAISIHQRTLIDGVGLLKSAVRKIDLSCRSKHGLCILLRAKAT